MQMTADILVRNDTFAHINGTFRITQQLYPNEFTYNGFSYKS